MPANIYLKRFSVRLLVRVLTLLGIFHLTVSQLTGILTDIRSISARIDESKFARAITLLTSDSVVLARSQTGGLLS